MSEQRPALPQDDEARPHPAAWYLHPRPVWLGGNDVTLLQGGDQLFPALRRAMAAARHEIWLATYIFETDDAARGIVDSLIAASLRGVRVRLVVDGFGSHRSLSQLQEWLSPHPVGLVVFRPLTRWWNWLQPGQLRRLHQKLCVVDGDVAFVGGINLIDDRHDLHHGWTDQPRFDFALQVRGPVVAPIEQTVRAIWTRAAFGRDWRQEVLALARSTEPLHRARRLLKQLRIQPARAVPVGDVEPVEAAFLVRDNLRQRRSIERSLIEAIRSARQSVDLVTPYFYPGRAFRRALGQAAQRGVKVRLLLQGKLDYRLAGLAAEVLYDELLGHGVEVFEYTPAFLHAKMVVVDRRWATLGSSNVDPLSLLLNLEANLAVRDAELAGAMGAAFDQAVAASRQVTKPSLARGPWAFLRRAFVAWLAHSYLRLAGLNGRY
ncbi:cardiolipin synthase ClsB [Ideonella margarita]|uniref:Cardiolipin synthase B n=1 Tax=Ideonella margarita TaxID=2984191 RepID=A0ABU9C4D0_9BURK